MSLATWESGASRVGRARDAQRGGDPLGPAANIGKNRIFTSRVGVFFFVEAGELFLIGF